MSPQTRHNTVVPSNSAKRRITLVSNLISNDMLDLRRKSIVVSNRKDVIAGYNMYLYLIQVREGVLSIQVPDHKPLFQSHSYLLISSVTLFALI